MNRNLFFVDSIFTPIEGENSVVSLLSAEEEGNEAALVLTLNSDQLRMYNHPGTIREGWYVNYEKGKQTPFGYGNLSSYARERFREYYQLREQLSEKMINEESVETIEFQSLSRPDGAQVISYHVKVGHGNCSILLIKSADNSHQIWMVDCSIIDKTDHWRDNSKHLVETFKAISSRLGKPENEPLHIDRFFLTHAHHDHYNGIEYLVNNHHIDKRTVCYVNLYYQMACKSYLRALTALKNAKVKFVEPVTGNSITSIKFLHPICRLYRSEATVKSASKDYRIVTNPVNDSSVVIMFSIAGRSMVFTGDLEQKGFKRMSEDRTCSPYLFDSDYYVVSHHGSLNGHPDMDCRNPSRPKPTPLICASNRLKKAILMGRDNAYPGIYDARVTSHWNKTGGGLVVSENASHYVELDWGSGSVSLH